MVLLTRAPALRLVLFRQLQQVHWQLQQRGDQVEITCDTRVFRWYWALVLLSVTLLPALIGAALLHLLQSSTPGNLIVWGGITVMSMLLGILIFSLFDAYGGAAIDKYWELLQDEAAGVGTCLARVSDLFSERRLRWSMGYAMYVLLLLGVLFFICIPGSQMAQHLTETLMVEDLMVAVVILIGALMLAVLIFVTERVMDSRMEVLVPGFLTMLWVLSVAVSANLWMLVSSQSPDDYQALEGAVYILHGAQTPSHLSANEVARLVDRAGMALAFIGFICFVEGLLLVGRGITIYYVIKAARITSPTIARSRIYPNLAFRGAGHRDTESLLAFRVLFGGHWALLTLLMGMGVIIMPLCTAAAVIGPSAAIPCARWVTASQKWMSLLMIGCASPVAVGAVVRAWWICLGLVFIALFVISLGELLWQRRALRRDLRSRAVSRTGVYAGLDMIVQEFSAQLGMAPPRTCVVDSPRVNAHAHEFGVGRRNRYIEVTTGALSALGMRWATLEALVGHELMHLQRRHVTFLNFLRWLGRATMVGDSFALAFANSFGFEKAADRRAVQKLDVSKEAMGACLNVLEMQTLAISSARASVGFAAEGQRPEASELDHGRAAKDGSAGRLSRLREGCRAFWRQYTHPFEVAYWHPHIKERIKALAAS